MKIKLEQTLDELEDALERERRSKLEQEKQRKKAENDFRVAQENVYIAEKCKSEHNEIICKKNKEIAALTNKLKDEQCLVSKNVKQVKECGVSINKH